MSVPVAIKTEEVILGTVDYNSSEELDEELQLQLEDSGGESYHIKFLDSEVHSRQRHQSGQKNMTGVGKNSTGTGASPTTNGKIHDPEKNVLESEKRMRREIANSHERRRMQSINAGFQNLRSLLPRHEGEKLSKAAILQQTSQYICELEAQKTQLLSQNSQLKRLLGQHEPGSGGGGGGDGASCGATVNGENVNGVVHKKRKLTDNIVSIQTISESSDEGLGSMTPEPMTLVNNNNNTNNNNAASSSTKSQMILAHNAATKEILDLKKQLDKERRLRTMLEDELQMIKRQLYSVATAPQPSGTTYIPREVIEHTDNLVRETIDDLPAGIVSYVEIDEMTGQPQVVVCSSIEELESEAAAAAAEIITEDNVHEEVILSSSTESEQEVSAIAKVYAGTTSPTPTVLQPILQAAIKATPKVEVERINDSVMKVKTEKIEQPSGLTRSRQNLETIVEAIRHLEGDHLFGDVNEQQKLQNNHTTQPQKAQEAPLALTNKQQQHAQRTAIAELRPYLQIKGNKQVTIVGGGGTSVTLTQQQIVKSNNTAPLKAHQQHRDTVNTTVNSSVTPTAIFKVQTTNSPAGNVSSGNTVNNSSLTTQHITITSSALKQCRPGVIVAKQLS